MQTDYEIWYANIFTGVKDTDQSIFYVLHVKKPNNNALCPLRLQEIVFQVGAMPDPDRNHTESHTYPEPSLKHTRPHTLGRFLLPYLAISFDAGP